MSSTHSANPACAAGKAVLEEIKSRDLIQASAIKGELLHKLLSNRSLPILIKLIECSARD